VELTQAPVARAEMLVRRPVAEVFEAFVDPGITSKFWFSRGTGRLEPGVTIQWHWEMYGFAMDATVRALEPNRRIEVEWGAEGEDPTIIEWSFTDRQDGTTFVSIANSGFTGTADEQVAMAVNSTEGFAFVLAGAKAWLEHGIALNLVPDRFPDGLG
jgi:uncharacterized protein YndB with AHSA1/START domain